MRYSKSQFARCGVEKNLGFLYNQNMAKRCGFPPVYKIERVAKMSAKHAFFSIFQKLAVFCCAIFFGFANAFSANLPSEYTELEYIESTGTQWIDTGVSEQTVTNLEIDFETSNSTSTNGFIFVNGTSQVGVRDARYGLSSPGRYTITESKNNVSVWVVKNETNGTTFTNMQYASSSTLALFNLMNATGTIGSYYCKDLKIYYFKAYNGNTLVQHLVPAKNSSGVVGMYDTVGNRFYTNQGTGEFIAGPVVGIRIATTAYNAARFNPVQTDLDNAVATIREIVTKTINQTAAIASLQADKQTRPEDACPAGKKCLLVEDNNGKPHWFPIIENICGVPSGYTCLDYIRSSGTAYIDTEYSPTSQTRIELVAKVDDGAGNVNIVGSGSAESTGASTQALMVINSYTDTEAEIKFGVSGSWDRVPVSMTAKNTFSMSATEFRVNGVVKKTFSGSIANTGNKPFYLFQRWRPEITSANSRVQIYEFNIYENDVLVRHMVPAKQGTTVGMYDTVNDRFYTNAGTGSLTAGSEI